MSDEEYYEEEDEVEEEEEEEEYEEEEEEEAKEDLHEKKSVRSEISQGESDGNFLKARLEAKKGELDEQLMEYINEWRKQRSKEEEELKRLKEKQAKRKEVRAEQEKKLAQQKKEEEERMRREEAEKKAKEAEEKRKRLEEAEKKRQAMMAAQKEKQQAAGSQSGSRKDGPGMANIEESRRQMTKTKEQLEEEKKISLSIRIKPLDLESLDSDGLRQKATDLWDTIIRLETEKYDIEEKQKRQNYDLKELKERQKQQLRQKAMKKGLDPEALTGKYPPKIRMYSKYERRTDTRTYDDRKKLYEGGWTVLYSEVLEKDWKEKHDDWAKRSKAKLPKWFGERPGKKTGDPESPDGGDEAAETALEVEEDDDEEEPKEDEEEEEEEEEEE